MLRVLRTMVPMRMAQNIGVFVRSTLSEAGDDDLIAPWDDKMIAVDDQSMNGVIFPHVRAARRALKQGDRARAEELARAIVQAWGVADAEVPAVAEMRKLVTD